MSDSVRPHRRQPTRHRHPWDSPGKNTGVGCHFLLQCMKVKVKSLSRVRLLATPWTIAYQAPLSMRFSRQEYWSGWPLPSPSTFHIYVLLFSNKKENSNLDSEKAMAPHSSTLAWKISWTEEPGRLQSMGSLGVRHDCITFK